MSESGPAMSGETARLAASSVTTMSGEKRPAALVNSSVTSINTPVQANRIHGSLLPVGSGILMPRRLINATTVIHK